MKGHTQMECDSVHALIEKQISKQNVYLPAQFVDLTKQARPNPMPYDAKYLTHNFFLDFTKVELYKSIRPGKKVGDPTVTDLRCLKLLPDGEIMFKLHFDEDFKNLPQRCSIPVLEPNKLPNPTRLYKQRLPVPYKKWKHKNLNK